MNLIERLRKAAKAVQVCDWNDMLGVDMTEKSLEESLAKLEQSDG